MGNSESTSSVEQTDAPAPEAEPQQQDLAGMQAEMLSQVSQRPMLDRLPSQPAANAQNPWAGVMAFPDPETKIVLPNDKDEYHFIDPTATPTVCGTLILTEKQTTFIERKQWSVRAMSVADANIKAVAAFFNDGMLPGALLCVQVHLSPQAYKDMMQARAHDGQITPRQMEQIFHSIKQKLEDHVCVTLHKMLVLLGVSPVTVLQVNNELAVKPVSMVWSNVFAKNAKLNNICHYLRCYNVWQPYGNEDYWMPAYFPITINTAMDIVAMLRVSLKQDLFGSAHALPRHISLESTPELFKQTQTEAALVYGGETRYVPNVHALAALANVNEHAMRVLELVTIVSV